MNGTESRADQRVGDAPRRVALIVATLTSFLTPLMGSAFNVALPSIGKEFSMNAVLLGWIASAYLLAAAVFLVPFGRISDIHGRKRVLAYGLAGYTVSSFLCGASTSSTWLLAARVLQGITAAAMLDAGVAILTSVYPASERGRVLGINVAAVYLGLSLGPFIGGILTHAIGWRSVFYMNVPLGLAAVILIAWRLKGEWAGARGEKFDFVGSLIFGAAMLAIMYGFSELPSRSGAWVLAAGVLGTVAFVRWEMSAESPVLDIALFRHNTVFAFSNLAALINYSGTAAVGFLLSLYLQYAKGLNPQHAGFVLVAQPTVMALFSPLAGRLSDRIEPRIVASTGMAVTAAGLLLLIFLTLRTPLPFVVLSLIVLGIGFGLFSSPNTNAVMGSVGERSYGLAAATLGTMRLTGQMLSIAIAMLIFSLYLGRVQITPQYYPVFVHSARVAFSVFVALCVGGIFASMARGKARSDA